MPSDLYNLNSAYGSVEELKNCIDEMHNQDLLVCFWTMIQLQCVVHHIVESRLYVMIHHVIPMCDAFGLEKLNDIVVPSTLLLHIQVISFAL